MRFLLLSSFILIAVCAVRSTGWAEGASPCRESAVAGMFYPKDRTSLGRMIDGFLSNVPDTSLGSAKPFLLIVPHAGYVYSAQTAAYAYKQLETYDVDTVILIGPSHRVPIQGASVWAKGSWQTPLGTVPIDEEIAEKIVRARPEFGASEAAHDGEHSLEVQVPFLQKVLKHFKIVPILMNNDSPENTRRLAKAVSDAIRGKKAVVVVSTDMSHYYSEGQANEMDQLALTLIEKKDIEGLREKLNQRDTELCGDAGVLTALEIDKLAGGLPIRVLDHTTSAKASHDTKNVVGYTAVVFYTGGAPAEAAERKARPSDSEKLTAAEKTELLAIARTTLEKYLKKQERYEPMVINPRLKEKRAAFVTLRERGQLRGCIGQIMPQEALYLAVRDMAIEAAVHDPRFPEVTAKELKDIAIDINVLTVPKRAASADEIVLGRHGVIVRRGFQQGVFLPSVAEETNWSKEDFLGELCAQKAGLPREAWKDRSTELLIFEADEFGEKDK